MGGFHSKPRRRRVAVLGSGPAGLTAAYTLLRNNPDVTLDIYDANPSSGGAVSTSTDSGFTFDLGPNSMNAKHPAVHTLLHSPDQLNLSSRIDTRSSARRFLILKNGKLTTVPMSPSDFLKSDLLSLRAKLRLLIEPFVPKGNVKDETVASFVKRRFGSEVLEWMVDPAVAGIYSAGTAQLSMKYAFRNVWDIERKKGSVIGGFLLSGKGKGADSQSNNPVIGRKELMKSFNYDDGMTVLTDTLEQRIQEFGSRARFMYHTPVRSIDQVNSKMIKYNKNKSSSSSVVLPRLPSCEKWRINGKRKRYDAIISSIPVHNLSNITSNVRVLRKGFRKLANLIPYAPVSVVVLGFDKTQMPKDIHGFGALIPSQEKREILGVNFTSEGFPKRLSKEGEGKVFWTVYMGGGRNPEIIKKPGEEIVQTAVKELQDVFGVEGEPKFSRLKNWENGIPSYGKGYEEALCALARIEKKGAGSLSMAGNYRGGVGVPDALLSGIESANKVSKYLQSL